MKSPVGNAIAAGTALAIVACTGEIERPTEQMVRASTLIEQAEKAGAQRYAAAELQQARDKLAAADHAAEKGKEDQARWLAEEAVADAELAGARTASGEAKRAAEEVARGTQTLEQEAERSNP
jgi:hypothetical protein